MDSPNQPEETEREFGKLVGQFDALVYAALKQGRVSEYTPSRIAQGVVFHQQFLAVNVQRQQSVAGAP